MTHSDIACPISWGESSWIKWVPLAVTSFWFFHARQNSLCFPTSIDPGSAFINNFGIGIAIFICTLFLTILAGKSLSRAVTWTGVGSIDKTFGLLFGFFKGYVVSICLFSILNWFYPYQNWGISAEDAISFNIISKGSEILIEEFPSSKDFIDTKEKIEKI